MANPDLRFAVSQQVEAGLRGEGLQIVASPVGAAALEALASQLHTKLPEDPRLLVVAPSDILHTGEQIILNRPYVPHLEEDDIVVRLEGEQTSISEADLTAGILRGLAQLRRANQNAWLNRTGLGLITVGATGGGSAALAHRQVWANVGVGVFAAGLGLIGYANNRTSTPEVRGLDEIVMNFAPPLRLAEIEE